MAVIDANRITYNRPNISRISEDSRNIFSIKVKKADGTAPAANDYLDLLEIPPHYQIERVSIWKKATNAAAYKLVISNGPALSDKADDGSTARSDAKDLVTLAASALTADTWEHFGVAIPPTGNSVVQGGLNWWLEHDKPRALGLKVTTWAAGDLNDEIKFIVSWFDSQPNYRGD